MSFKKERTCEMKIVLASELAKDVGVSSARIRALIGRGILDDAIIERPFLRTGPYKLDLIKARDCLNKYLSVKQESNIRAGRSGSVRSSKLLSDRDKLLRAQIRKELATAKIRENELATAEGKLVNFEDMKREIFSGSRMVRDAIMNIPDRVAAIIAAETDEHKVRLLLDREIRQSLQGLCDDFEKRKDIASK
ncbi:MAG: hypothetical protein V2B19_30940 [Pseudomonadota bacterium]